MAFRSSRRVEENTDPILDYSRRNASSVYSTKRKKRTRGVRILKSIIITLLSLCILCAGAAAIYIGVLQNRLSGDGSISNNLRGILTERQAPTDPYYCLLLGTDGRPGEKVYRTDTILLARIDPQNKKVTLVSIPRDTPVEIPGHGRQKINAAHAFGGPQQAVKTVSEFCGVPITHYVEVSFDGFKEVVDALGGVEVDVPDKVNDKDAGPDVIQPGLQTLNGSQALTFCRTRHYSDGDYRRMQHQRIFITALINKVLNNMNPAQLVGTVDSVSKMVLTDMSVTDIVSLAEQFKGMDTSTIMTGVVPSEPKTVGGVAYVIPFVDEWKEMMKRVDAGESPEEKKLNVNADLVNAAHLAQVISSDPANSSYHITIMNGTMIKGAASTCAKMLKSAGYDVVATSDLDASFSKTEVYYKKPEDQQKAEKVVQDLKLGGASKDKGTIAFKGDLLVVIGTDWADIDTSSVSTTTTSSSSSKKSSNSASEALKSSKTSSKKSSGHR